MEGNLSRKYFGVFTYLITAIGVVTGLLTLDGTPVEAQTSCYWVLCYPYQNYVCQSHNPPCNYCYNMNGRYCGGPC